MADVGQPLHHTPITRLGWRYAKTDRWNRPQVVRLIGKTPLPFSQRFAADNKESVLHTLLVKLFTTYGSIHLLSTLDHSGRDRL